MKALIIICIVIFSTLLISLFNYSAHRNHKELTEQQLTVDIWARRLAIATVAAIIISTAALILYHIYA